MRHLALRLEGPLVAFGDVMVDAVGPVRDTPSTALVTGLLGNALGLRREETEALARLQERLVFAARLDRRAERFVEFQTAELGAGDRGWTTRGRPEGRAGGAGTYLSPHIRRRTFDADVSALVVLRLEPADESPDLDRLAEALIRPARPLFLGRKSCLPSAPLFAGFAEADDLLGALKALPLAGDGPRRPRGEIEIVLPATEPMPEHFRRVHVCDRRDWVAGVHTGDSVVFAGHLPRTAFESEGRAAT